MASSLEPKRWATGYNTPFSVKTTDLYLAIGNLFFSSEMEDGVYIRYLVLTITPIVAFVEKCLRPSRLKMVLPTPFLHRRTLVPPRFQHTLATALDFRSTDKTASLPA